MWKLYLGLPPQIEDNGARPYMITNLHFSIDILPDPK